MTDYTTLSNAPITEALLDIRVEIEDTFDYEQLKKACAAIKGDFPDLKEQASVTKQFTFEQEDLTAKDIDKQLRGYFAHSSDKKKIAQYRIDGFTFNKLKPYENWEVFHSEAKLLWENFIKYVPIKKIHRIALRYINRIELPLPLEGEFKDYILTVPEIARTLPQGLKGFFMRLDIPNVEIQAIAVINQTMEKPTPTGILPYIFDIDVIKETNFTEDTPEMWEMFNQLREFKNKIFFDSLTDKAKELFE